MNKNKQGFSLIEVLVSVALFSVIILAISGIFKLAIDGQRNAIATQNVQESLKYFLEVTAKEIRMAQKNQGACSDIPNDSIFSVSSNDYGNVLSFKNYYGECVKYNLAADGDNLRFQISRGDNNAPVVGFISPAKIKINNLSFKINSTASTTQPMVTINLEASALASAQYKAKIILQTSVTSRYYK